MTTPTITPLKEPDTSRRSPSPLTLALIGIAVLGLMALVYFGVSNLGADDPAVPIGPAPTPAPDPDPPADGVPEAVTETAAAIESAAATADWERLAAIALADGTPFTATFGEDLATEAELAAYWRGLATEEDLPRILNALLRLPDWAETTAQDAAGADISIFVTPAFMHEPTATNRAALEDALGAEWLEMQMADGQYLGWRLGITADGDWQFFVQGD